MENIVLVELVLMCAGVCAVVYDTAQAGVLNKACIDTPFLFGCMTVCANTAMYPAAAVAAEHGSLQVGTDLL